MNGALNTTSWAAALLVLFAAPAAAEDVLEQKNGALLIGKFMGGTAETVRFQAADGLKVIPLAEVIAITFDRTSAPPPPPAPQPPPPPPQPPPPAPAASATVPAGTLLIVKMRNQVTSSSAKGTRFEAELAGDLVAGDVVVAKAGTTVYGRVEATRQAGRLAGRSALALSLTEVSIGGRLVPITTSDFAEVTQNEFRKTARNAALGAGVGAAFDGGKGAAKGAAIGGAASVLRRGSTIVVPAGTILEFRLVGPLNT